MKQLVVTKTIVLLAILTAIALSSCGRYYTPYQAANTGGKRCNDHHRIR
jgi:hypothetical protein